jgi:hypothetical protein
MQDHPQYNEIKYSLELFNSKGFTPISFNDGYDEDFTTTDINTIIEGVLSVDEAWVDLKHKDGMVYLAIVLGNEPGVAICNYSCNNTVMPLVDIIHEEIYNHFN